MTQFRLKDVVVAAVIISALVLLTSYWVLSSRAGSRRQICQSNLKKISTALDAYHEAQGAYPPAAEWAFDYFDLRDPVNFDQWHFQPGVGSDRTRGNWAIRMLPYLGEAKTYELFDPSLLISHQKHGELRRAEVPIWKCPADGDRNHSKNRYRRVCNDPSAATHYARGNYAINAGSHRDALMPGWPFDPVPDGYTLRYDVDSEVFQLWGNGVAGINQSFSERDFPHGKAHVIAIDEIRAGILPIDGRGSWALGQIGGSITAIHGVHGDATGPNSQHQRADDIADCAALYDALGPKAMGKLGMPCCFYCPGNRQATARSLHRGGVNALFLSGTVVFCANQIDAGVWHATHSRNSRAGSE